MKKLNSIRNKIFKNKFIFLTIFFLALSLLIFIIINKFNFFNSDNKNYFAINNEIDNFDKYFKSGKYDYLIGNQNSEIKVVIYFDLDCIWCKRLNDVFKEKYYNNYANSVGFIFRNNPLTYLHPNALTKAKYLSCINDQASKETDFLYYSSLLYNINPYSNYTENASTALDIEKSIKEDTVNKIDMSILSKCIKEDLVLEKIKNDVDLAIQDQITKTPTILIYYKNTLLYSVVGGEKNLKKLLNSILYDRNIK